MCIRDRAQRELAWVQTLLSRACPTGPSLSLRHVRLGFSSDELRVVPRVFAYLVNVCSYLVWIQRNDFRFHSIPPSAVKLIALMKARLSFHFFLEALPLPVAGSTFSGNELRMGCLDPFRIRPLLSRCNRLFLFTF